MFNWLQAAIVAIVTALGAFGLHSLDVQWLKSNQESALDEQKTAIVSQCTKAQETAEGVSHDYQNQLTNLNRQLDSLRTRTTCVPIAPTSPGYSSAAGQPKPVNEGAIYDLAGEGEKYRIQLIGCQDFINKTWGKLP